MSERLVRYYQSHGIITGYAAGHAPSSNGIAEYYNQSGIETLLTNAKLPKDYWMLAHPLKHRDYANRKIIQHQAAIHRLKAFGCRVSIQHASVETNKISPTRSQKIFLGFGKTSNAAIIQVNGEAL
ncbi:hypothetical protein E3Q06_00153 [Wallemia mellicola]|uniref:Integrase catalytic domain-containing protein n=1 Tax=Wallemia mellicola TaxID=1708541 RepID=A0A4T0N3D1_9BASI|nr:hypothetical protein E3Q24_02282 [Wallemia mellicola]TIB90980.1 hypothetical protein E3Q21_00153 [Wallemia mellicola]TIB92686.1 hypothetical protein E3Q20_00153 [Wallemia mellicola]TIC16662.1 hypothetical protein E3Q13_02883 [Wallemia mellicola]TIC22598.1 hypothetical protein E3Q12_02563 [Wallemia mellicola]